MSPYAPSINQLKNALVIAEKIQQLEAELASILGTSDSGEPRAAVKTEVTPKPAQKKKRTMSADARARIAAAQKARWAKTKGEAISTTAAAKAKPAKSKRKISPEGRAKMSAAAKKRWAGKKS